MPNLDPWINQTSNKNEEHMVATNTINKFENHLLSIKEEDAIDYILFIIHELKSKLY